MRKCFGNRGHQNTGLPQTMSPLCGIKVINDSLRHKQVQSSGIHPVKVIPQGSYSILEIK
eukprot:2280884-Amphidinium_carterae.2